MRFEQFEPRISQTVRWPYTVHSSSQKYSNKHILNHNFFRLGSFGFKFSGNFYIYLDQILAKNLKFWLQLYTKLEIHLWISNSQKY
jgi:hypothetical protein